MKKILLVDDEPKLLAALQRALRKHFEIEVAEGGFAGLAMLQDGREFSVVVSDMRMPGMNGAEFLSKVEQAAPNVVRVMLTGNSDQPTAIEAVNRGHIFRFLNKPCSPEDLAEAINAGIRQHQLITAERDLLENTVRGSVEMLTEIMTLADPKAFGDAERLRDNMRHLAAAMEIKELWELEVAALFSLIGLVTLPAELLLKGRSGGVLSPHEQELFHRIPAISGGLVARIPRLEGVAKILTYQNKCFDGSGLPDDAVAGTDIPLGARMLKILCDLAELEGAGKSHSSALEKMRERTGWYDPQILELLNSPNLTLTLTHSAPVKPSLSITFSQMRIGHVLRSEVTTRDGMLIVIAGNRITPALMERLRNFSQLFGVKEPIFVEP